MDLNMIGLDLVESSNLKRGNFVTILKHLNVPISISPHFRQIPGMDTNHKRIRHGTEG